MQSKKEDKQHRGRGGEVGGGEREEEEEEVLEVWCQQTRFWIEILFRATRKRLIVHREKREQKENSEQQHQNLPSFLRPLLIWLWKSFMSWLSFSTERSHLLLYFRIMSTCVFVIMKLSFLENLGDVLLRVFQKYKDTPRVSPNTEEHTSHATFVLPELAARGAFPSFSVFFALAILPLSSLSLSSSLSQDPSRAQVTPHAAICLALSEKR